LLGNELNTSKQALAIAQEAGNREGETIILDGLGLVAVIQDQSMEAAHYFEQALAISQELANRDIEVISRHIVGMLADHQGRPTEAALPYTDCGDLRGDRRP
jgi:hypothetical protein